MLHAAGPLGSSIIDTGGPSPGPRRQSNGQIVLRRIAWVTDLDGIPDSKESKGAYERLWRLSSGRTTQDRLLRAVHARRSAALRRLQARGNHVEEIEAKPVWRAVVGLGDEVPQETGVRLHGTYGIPILPGQSLKGLAAIEGAETDDDYLVPQVMGSPQSGGNPDNAALGQVIFLDAIPTQFRLAVDVMTPHVTDYYEHGQPPAEYWQPNPVSFLVLTRDTTFRIQVIGRGTDAADVAGFAKEWLEHGLTNRGVGAKTSAGYGYMTVTAGD